MNTDNLKALGDSILERLGPDKAGMIYQAIDELERHRKFSSEMLSISWHGGDATGEYIQEVATRCGIAEIVLMDHPCGKDGCGCRELLDDDGFPVECCRKKY